MAKNNTRLTSFYLGLPISRYQKGKTNLDFNNQVQGRQSHSSKTANATIVGLHSERVKHALTREVMREVR